MLNLRKAVIVFLTLFLGCHTEQRQFSFGVFTDVQYCDCDASGVRHFRTALGKFRECVDEFNSKNLAFVIQLGDIIDRDFASLDTVLSIWSRLKAPSYHVLGNHEFSVAQDMKDKVLTKMGVNKGYYDFSVADWRFVVLDGNDISTYRFPKTSKAYANAKAKLNDLQKQELSNAQDYNGALSQEQMTWLDGVLGKACRNGERVILFCHHPVFPKTIHALWNDKEVMNLLESHDCVVAYMNGHNHDGNYQQKNGIHYLTLKGMVDTANENAFAIIEVYDNRLQVTGYGREPNRTLSLSKENLKP